MNVGRTGRIWIALGVMLVGMAPSVQVVTQDAEAMTAAAGVYTDAQAERGRDVYREHCTYCHHHDLLGGEDLEVIPPALVGASFRERWYGESVGDMMRVVAETMPWRTMALAPQAYADVVSYMLQENGYPSGAVELPSDPSLVSHVFITEDR